MKNLVLVLVIAITTSVNAQWVAKKVNNGLDDPYKICYNENIFGELFKIEKTFNGESLTVYIKSISLCDEKDIDTDLAFLVNGEWVKYNFVCNSIGTNMIVVIGDILSENNTDILRYFKIASKIKFRFNYEDCEETTHEFSMSGSTAALNFMRN